MSHERHTVQTALNYIEHHIYDDIDGSVIAAVCGLSVRHLYRLFSEHTGHTLKHYLRARRLTLASEALLHSDRSIIDIAFSHQFQSPEVFTRAFRRTFWVTPSQFRKIGCQHNITQQPAISEALLDYNRSMSCFNPDIITLESRYFFGIRRLQSHFGLRTPDNWQDVQAQIKRLPSGVSSQSVWQVFARQTQQLCSRFDAMECMIGVLLDNKIPPPSFSGREWAHEALPDTLYAKFPYPNAHVAYETLLQHAYRWLKNSPFGHADAPTLFQSTSLCGRFGFLFLPVTTQTPLRPMKWWYQYDAILQTELGSSAH